MTIIIDTLSETLPSYAQEGLVNNYFIYIQLARGSINIKSRIN